MRPDGNQRGSRQLQLQLSTTSQPDAARRARRALDAFHELQADPERAADVRLLVSELVTNAVVHGSGDQQERVELRAELDHQRLRVTVSDGGVGFILGEQTNPPAPEETNGRGLYLLRTLADRFGVERDDGGGHVWFEVELRT